MKEDNKNQKEVDVRKPRKPSIFKVVKTGIKEAKDSIAEAVEYTADSFNETAEKVQKTLV